MLAVPSFASQLLTEVAAKYTQLSLVSIQSTPTTRLFPENSACFEVTHGGCSCGLFPEPRRSVDEVLAKERAHLARKGWSETKIARAMSSKAKALAKPKSRGPESGMFSSLVSEVVGRGVAVRVYAHFYSGNQRTESIPPAAQGIVALGAFRDAGFPPDAVTLVRAES